MRFKTKDFDLKQTLECGQCFRFKKIEDYHYIVIAKGVLEIKQSGDVLDFMNIGLHDFFGYWNNYFDLKTDYSKIKSDIIKRQPFMKEIIEKGSGIHILRQDPLETIVSFIISQNKRIPQIKNCIEILCNEYGEKVSYNGENYSLFPSLDVLKTLTVDDFKKCKVGFRDKYLYETIQKIANGEFSLEYTDDIEKRLCSLYGIGPKVAACIALFAYHQVSVFPIDTWIKKMMTTLYFNGKNIGIKEIEGKSKLFGPYRGIAQQYLFFAAISEPDILEKIEGKGYNIEKY